MNTVTHEALSAETFAQRVERIMRERNVERATAQRVAFVGIAFEKRQADLSSRGECTCPECVAGHA